MKGTTVMSKHDKGQSPKRKKLLDDLEVERFTTLLHTSGASIQVPSITEGEPMRIPHNAVPVTAEFNQVDVPQMFRNFSSKPSMRVVESTVTKAIRGLEKTVASYDVVCGEQIQEIKRLREESMASEKSEPDYTLEDKLAEAWKERDELKKQLIQLASAKGTSAAQIRDFREDIAELKSINAGLERKLNESELAFFGVRDDLEHEEQEYVMLQKEHEEECAVLNKVAENLGEQLRFRNRQLTAQRLENTRLKGELDEAKGQVADEGLAKLREKLTGEPIKLGKERFMMSVEPRHNDLVQIDRLHEDNSDLRKQLGKIREELFQSERYNQELRKENSLLGDRINELRNDIDDREDTCFTATQVITLIDAAKETA